MGAGRAAVSWVRWASFPTSVKDAVTRAATAHAARAALALALGPEGWRVRAARDHPAAPPWRREVPAVAILRRGRGHTDLWDGTRRQGREADNIPPAARCISAPDASDAHPARPPTPQWVGDNVHSPATCEEALPPLLTHIATTPGPTAAGAATPPIHAVLGSRGRCRVGAGAPAYDGPATSVSRGCIWAIC
jgi:hypothetical protein